MTKYYKPNKSMLIVNAIKQKKVVVLKTDTITGIVCHSSELIPKIFEIKNRDFNKPLQILTSDIITAKQIGVFNKKSFEILFKFRKQNIPCTLIVPVNDKFYQKHLSHFKIYNSKTIGIRIVTDNNWFKQILKNVSYVFATSYNKSGVDHNKQNSNESISDKIDGIVLNRNKYSTSKASVVYDSINNKYLRY